jgi:hypothetical protein
MAVSVGYTTRRNVVTARTEELKRDGVVGGRQWVGWWHRVMPAPETNRSQHINVSLELLPVILSWSQVSISQGVYWPTESLIDIRRDVGAANAINSSVDQYTSLPTGTPWAGLFRSIADVPDRLPEAAGESNEIDRHSD